VKGQKNFNKFFKKKKKKLFKNVQKGPPHSGLYQGPGGHLGLFDLSDIPTDSAALGEEKGHGEDSVKTHQV
jgi:hypothetical protein